jgi:hypothetical protein
MPTDKELAAAYQAWWFESYKHPPNAAAVATATHWARHVLATYGANEETEIANYYDRLAAQHPGQAVYHPAGSPAPDHGPV